MGVEKLDSLVEHGFYFSWLAFLYVKEASVKLVGQDLFPLVPFPGRRGCVQNLPSLEHME